MHSEFEYKVMDFYIVVYVKVWSKNTNIVGLRRSYRPELV